VLEGFNLHLGAQIPVEVDLPFICGRNRRRRRHHHRPQDWAHFDPFRLTPSLHWSLNCTASPRLVIPRSFSRAAVRRSEHATSSSCSPNVHSILIHYSNLLYTASVNKFRLTARM